MSYIGRMVNTALFFPFAHDQFGKVGVALDHRVNLCKVKPCCIGHGKGVDLRTSDDETLGLSVVFCQLNRRADLVKDYASGGPENLSAG